MIEFTKQCKGTDADKLKISDNEVFWYGKKYDGVYIQIQKEVMKLLFLLLVEKDLTVCGEMYF